MWGAGAPLLPTRPVVLVGVGGVCKRSPCVATSLGSCPSALLLSPPPLLRLRSPRFCRVYPYPVFRLSFSLFWEAGLPLFAIPVPRVAGSCPKMWGGSVARRPSLPGWVPRPCSPACFLLLARSTRTQGSRGWFGPPGSGPYRGPRVLGVVPRVLGVVPRVLEVVPRVLGVVPRVLGGGSQGTRGGPQGTRGGPQGTRGVCIARSLGSAGDPPPPQPHHKAGHAVGRPVGITG